MKESTLIDMLESSPMKGKDLLSRQRCSVWEEALWPVVDDGYVCVVVLIGIGMYGSWPLCMASGGRNLTALWCVRR